MTRDEENRKLAEWLGWTFKPFKGARTVFADEDEWCVQPITEKYECEALHVPECSCPANIITTQACVSAKLPDFRSDEAANAMLRDKVRGLLFSQRREIKRQLQISISNKMGIEGGLVALEELVILATPDDWCNAALALLERKS